MRLYYIESLQNTYTLGRRTTYDFTTKATTQLQISSYRNKSKALTAKVQQRYS